MTTIVPNPDVGPPEATPPTAPPDGRARPTGAPQGTTVPPSTAPGPAATGTNRLEALDRFRGVALMAMLLHHLCEWLSGDARQVLPGRPSFTLTDVAAPAFFVAAGASCSLLVTGRRRRGASALRIAGVVLRRYGVLVPVGTALAWFLWREPFAFGVLEALGTTVCVAAVLGALLPGGLVGVAATTAMVAGVMVERDVTGQTDWLAVEFWAGNFPAITYLGFVLVGMAAMRSGRFVDRRWVAGAAVHTFGLFLAHYGIYWLLDLTGLLREVPDVLAVPVAASVAALLCVVAPHLPQLPWSVRTGWRRPR